MSTAHRPRLNVMEIISIVHALLFMARDFIDRQEKLADAPRDRIGVELVKGDLALAHRILRYADVHTSSRELLQDLEDRLARL